MGWFSNLPLTRRISLLVLSGLVIGLSLFSWLGVRSLNESTERILNQRLIIARTMAKYLDETLKHALFHLQNATNQSRRLPTKEEFRKIAASFQETFSESGIPVRHTFLTDSGGKIINVEPAKPEIMGTSISHYPDAAKVLSSGLPTISNLINSPPIEGHVVLAIAPILDEKGNIVGTLTSSIDIERSRISTFGETISVGTTGYLEIVDGNGIVLARTEPGSPPASFEMSDHPGRFSELINEGKATVGTCHRCHETKQEVQRRRDVLAFAPLATASWGVAIRQSEEEALAPTRLLESRLFLLGTLVLLFTAFLVWFVTQGIVKPIRELTTAAKRVAMGNFKAVTPLARRDEIGQLTAAFYAMTQELAISRDELMSRNEELSALNAIATTVSQSLDLKNVLENALLKVLEVTRATIGCVFLRESNSDKLVMMKCVGSSDVFQCGHYGSIASCACHQVLRSGQMLMVKDASQCPALGKGDVDCFVCLPLKSKDRALGIINVACSGERSFTESDFKLLDSIGHHVGLAIENSILYKDAKEKEQIRGQLLSRAIGAQEEERKRIARELHDEYGQTLTGLVMSIESLEVITPSTETRVREKLQNAKILVSRALDDIRKLTLDLRPSTLDDLGLVSTVRSYAQNHLEAQGVHVDIRSKGLRTLLAPPIEIALFRIIQEAIHNIIKYAAAHNVKIQLEAKDGKIMTIIEDDGKGFDVTTVLKNKMERQSLGLLGIEERAGLLGGTLTIESQEGKGTRLAVQIPFVPLEKQDVTLNRLG